MAKRPALTEDTFLKHLFSPRKNPLPTGIRKRTLKVGPAIRGYTKARVASFNRMSPANQELLKRSGWEVNYLKGTASLKDAKATLRETAVRKGYARPTKTRSVPANRMSPLDAQVALHAIRELRKDGRSVDADRVIKYSPYLPGEDKTMMLSASAGRIRAYAKDRNNVVIIDGQEVNPMWYHPS